MMTKYSLTPEHRAQLKPWADRWIANAMSTKPMDDHDREQMRSAIAQFKKDFVNIQGEVYQQLLAA